MSHICYEFMHEIYCPLNFVMIILKFELFFIFYSFLLKNVSFIYYLLEYML